jgi:hypothetical protein
MHSNRTRDIEKLKTITRLKEMKPGALHKLKP